MKQAGKSTEELLCHHTNTNNNSVLSDSGCFSGQKELVFPNRLEGVFCLSTWQSNPCLICINIMVVFHYWANETDTSN